MKIELFLEGPRTLAAFAQFLPVYAAAQAEDAERWQNKLHSAVLGALNEDGAPAPTPAEDEKPKRVRAVKPKAEEPAKEPEPAIRATPEDRQPAPEPEAEEPEVVVGEVEDVTGYTRDDVKAALGAYAEKFGMAQAASEGVKLMGAPRISALPDDPAMFAAAVKALNEAVARG